MTFATFKITDLLLIEQKVYTDNRGSFFELFKQSLFSSNGIVRQFVQDNVSVSKKNVIRGLHFQKKPYEQGKLVTVIKGAARDVVVDLRVDSPTYGQHEVIELNDINRHLLWIPPGFAHGFAALEDNTCFFYKCTAPYHQASEGGIRYNDPELNIQWGIENPVLSEKDLLLPSLSEYKKQGGAEQ